MKLVSVSLTNFRSYKERTEIKIDSITALIGRNDIGKTTILDALNIFFNEEKFDSHDRTKECTDDDETSIVCCFSEFPDEIDIDEGAMTTLGSEYLLNIDGYLEIVKKYKKEKPAIFIRAYHPKHQELSLLHLKKNTELKKMIDQFGFGEAADKTRNNSMRKALWQLAETESFETQDIPADKEDAKKIYDKIKDYLPKYALFKSDRSSTDEDDEAQSPIKLATDRAIEEMKEKLDEIGERVTNEVQTIFDATLSKLREFDSVLTERLKPSFKKDEIEWKKAFSFKIESDNNIPMNKRGSGVRRLILLSFFRATAEMDSSGFEKRGIIYAIEEPETSQHPDNQKKIIDTFLQMVNNQNYQVMLTTHVPGLAGLIPLENIRHIKKNNDNTIVVNDIDNDLKIKEISDKLGILPSHIDTIKVIVCVEGTNDVEFLKNISKVLNANDNSIINLNNHLNVIIIPLGGSNVIHWATHQYLKKLRIPEYHLYDRDDDMKYKDVVDEVNNRGDGSSARLTIKRTMENYINQELVNTEYNINITINNDTDVVLTICTHKNPNLDFNTTEENKIKKIGKKKDKIKNNINRNISSRMTIELLNQTDPSGEVLGWLNDIKELVNRN